MSDTPVSGDRAMYLRLKAGVSIEEKSALLVHIDKHLHLLFPCLSERRLLWPVFPMDKALTFVPCSNNALLPFPSRPTVQVRWNTKQYEALHAAMYVPLRNLLRDPRFCVLAYRTTEDLESPGGYPWFIATAAHVDLQFVAVFTPGVLPSDFAPDPVQLKTLFTLNLTLED